MNLHGVYHCTAAVLPHMISNAEGQQQQGTDVRDAPGVILNMASVQVRVSVTVEGFCGVL